MILGFAYKANSSDFRNTKVIDLYNELKSFNIAVDISDPLVDKNEVKNTFDIEISNIISDKTYDLIYKAVDHKEFKIKY